MEGVIGMRMSLGGGERTGKWVDKQGKNLEKVNDLKYLRPANEISYLAPGKTEHRERDNIGVSQLIMPVGEISLHEGKTCQVGL